MQEHRTIWNHFVGFDGNLNAWIDTTYIIDTTVTIALFELQSGQHYLSTDGFSSLVFSFADTGKIYRYQKVDSSGNIKVVGTQYYEDLIYHQLTFHRGQGLISDTFWVTPYAPTHKIVNLIGSTIVSVNEQDVPIPKAIKLSQNYPNPFNPTTNISYTLSNESKATLSVINVLGQEVRKLVDGVEHTGFKSVEFDARDLPSGVYFYILQAGNFFDVKKMVLVK
jgi:hypothetical protein